MASLSEEESSCFQSAIVDSCRCSLCLNVLRKPVQCQRNEHHFCRACITQHLQQSMVCPSCEEDLSLETLRPASQILTKLVSQLKIRCDYNERGCNDIIEVEDYENHHELCHFAPIACSNKDCSEVVNRRDRESHETQACQFRLVNCSVCGECVVFRWYKMHSCVMRLELEEVKSSVTKIQESVTEMLTLIKPIDSYMFQGITRDIIVCGGQGCTSAEMYEWKTRKWVKQKQQMKFALEYGTSFLYKGELIVTGARGHGCSYRSGGMEAITLGGNFSESQWKSGLASLPYNCYAHATVLVGDHLLVFGGYQSSFLDGVHEVQLTTPFASKLLCYMPEPRCHHGAQLFGADKVVIAGGQTKEGASKEMLMYDLAENEWKKLAPLDKAVMKMATVSWKDNIILLGGQRTPDDSSPPTADVVMYNITTEKSTKLPSMRQARSTCAAVITGNTIVVMGGHKLCSNPDQFNINHGSGQQYTYRAVNTVEYFSFEFNSGWEELPPMKGARAGATAHVC